MAMPVLGEFLPIVRNRTADFEFWNDFYDDLCRFVSLLDALYIFVLTHLMASKFRMSCWSPEKRMWLIA